MKIKDLTLYSNQINAQKDFYGKVLDLEIVSENDLEFSVKVNNSILKFIQNEGFHPYHFAFTIPSNKINESLKWLKERVSILKDGDKDIVDFPTWNAESIYFYDADKNILEFIVRKNLKNSSEGEFGSDDILEISEIGLATQDFDGKFQTLTSIPDIEKFSGGKEVFAAIGSERGLFILIDKNRKDWFPSNDKAYSSEFKVIIGTEKNDYIVTYEDETLTYKVAET